VALVAGATVTIDMKSMQVDSYLYFVGPDGSVAAQNDDAGGTCCDSKIEYTVPVTGTWTIQATTWDNGATGNYSLSIAGCAASVSAPTAVTATTVTSNSIRVTWAASLNAVRYHVYRSVNDASYVQVNGEQTTETSFVDTSVISNTAYLYRVRAVSGAATESADSVKDLATTVLFTDGLLVARAISPKAVHVAELRTAVNAVRTLAGLSTFPFADSVLVARSTTIKRIHIVDLRTALDAARAILTLPPLSYTDQTLVQFNTVKAAHIAELRSGTQ
jgi:hypothetical protein